MAWIGYPSRVFLDFRSLADVVWFEFRVLSRIAQDERESASGSWSPTKRRQRWAGNAALDAEEAPEEFFFLHISLVREQKVYFS